MEIQRIKHTRVGDQVFEQLKSMIENGSWSINEKIPSEQELCDSLGVSHSTVRQALQRLNTLGMLQTRVGNGSFVIAVTPKNSLDLLNPTAPMNAKAWQDVVEFRIMVETYAVRMAARRATEADIQQLRRKCSALYEATGLKESAAADAAFHFEIGSITRNEMIIHSYEILQSVLSRSIVDEIMRHGIIRQDDHREILDAIASHNEDLAFQIMQRHLLDLSKSVVTD